MYTCPGGNNHELTLCSSRSAQFQSRIQNHGEAQNKWQHGLAINCSNISCHSSKPTTTRGKHDYNPCCMPHNCKAITNSVIAAFISTYYQVLVTRHGVAIQSLIRLISRSACSSLSSLSMCQHCATVPYRSTALAADAKGTHPICANGQTWSITSTRSASTAASHHGCPHCIESVKLGQLTCINCNLTR